MKRTMVIFFLLCKVVCSCVANGASRSLDSSPVPSPKMRVRRAIESTHFFKPTKRYFPCSGSAIRLLPNCLAIIGFASNQAGNISSLKRAAMLASLDQEGPLTDGLFSIEELFAKMCKEKVEHIPHQITLAILKEGLVKVAHAYHMYTSSPEHRSAVLKIDEQETVNVALKVIGEQAALPETIKYLLNEGDARSAIELLSSMESTELCITYGGILHINIPACLALIE